MRFPDLLTSADRSGLMGWLQASETHDLLVCLERPHSGGPGPWYLIRSVAELDVVLASVETWPELELTVFRKPQFPFRGIASGPIAQLAMAGLPDRDWYAVVSLPGPTAGELELLGATDDKAELVSLVRNATDIEVGVGL